MCLDELSIQQRSALGKTALGRTLIDLRVNEDYMGREFQSSRFLRHDLEGGTDSLAPQTPCCIEKSTAM